MFVFSTKALLSSLSLFCIILSGCAYVSHSTANDLDAQDIARDQPQAVSIWIPMKDGFALAPLNSPLVERQIKFYIASGTHLQDSFELSRPYLYFVLEEVKKRNMPTELALLPFLESSFNIRRGKSLNPAGLWGLMPVAARHLNLAQTPLLDERRDIVRSTQAALDLMQELYEKFGDWHLALAAYNWGPSNVSRAIANNHRRKLPTNYLSLSMPIETMVFVPKLLTLRKIIEDPVVYKTALPDILNKPYFEKIEVKHAIDISVVTQFAGISQDEFIDLNPSYNKSLIPAGKDRFLLLPVTRFETFKKNHQQFDRPLSSWKSVIVEQPQTLEAFAKQWQVDPNRTRQMNGLPMGITLKAGMMIVIPKPSFKDD
jgi:membrane-bound lytic murein transglycosylase D